MRLPRAPEEIFNFRLRVTREKNGYIVDANSLAHLTTSPYIYTGDPRERAASSSDELQLAGLCGLLSIKMNRPTETGGRPF